MVVLGPLAPAGAPVMVVLGAPAPAPAVSRSWWSWGAGGEAWSRRRRRVAARALPRGRPLRQHATIDEPASGSGNWSEPATIEEFASASRMAALAKDESI